MGERKTTNQKILKGRAVSRGIGLGKALCLYGQNRQFYRTLIDTKAIPKEIRRFNAAVRLANRQLKRISENGDGSIGVNQTGIFETHRLFLKDRSLLLKIENTIKEEMVNAEWAVKTVTDSYISRYKTLTDKHLREKYIDLEDITERLLTALGGGKRSEISLEENTIVVASEIKPSTLIELGQSNPVAVVTENGGWTSHSFILARELGIPAVTGLKGFLRTVVNGEELLVDGFEGEVIHNPTADTISDCDLRVQASRGRRELESDARIADPLKTLDGVEVTIRTNLDSSDGYTRAHRLGAKGIGLFRSEFLFNKNHGYPSEANQYEYYLKAAEAVGPDGVRIRTFDVGVEELEGRSIHGKNPALGLTGIRLSLRGESEFRTQLRALLRASHGRQLDIVFPLISDISEIRKAREILNEERAVLESKGERLGVPSIGVMIEVPSLILIIDKVVEEVDFICLGTNDLVQYLLAVDRDNEDVSSWFRTLHPAILKSLRMVVDASKRSDTPLIVCGEMAGSPLYALILIGLGARELSMNVNSIARVAKVISGIAFEEARDAVTELEGGATSDEVESLIRRNFASSWSHLFDDSSLPEKIVLGE